MFVQSNLPLSVWCGTLYDARHASVMWLQTADTESPEESFYFPRLTGPCLMLLGGLLSNHRSTKLPGKVANPCARPASCRFPPLPKRTGVSHNYFCAQISPGTLTQGKKRARSETPRNTDASGCDSDDENSGRTNSNVNVFLLLSGLGKDRATYSCLVCRRSLWDVSHATRATKSRRLEIKATSAVWSLKICQTSPRFSFF